jgi:CheY-like chemotaxis protein
MLGLNNTTTGNGDAFTEPKKSANSRSRDAPRPVILVADDEAMIRTFVWSYLQSEGYFVRCVTDGQEALELSRNDPGVIDLCITDVNMPRLKGTELCARLLEERPGIKLIVMTGEDGNDIVFPLISKPFGGEALIRKVRQVLAVPGQPPKHRPSGDVLSWT